MSSNDVVSDESEAWLDEILAKIERQYEAKQLRKDNPYVRDIIRVLWPYANGLGRRYVIDRVWQLRNAVGVTMPRTFEQTVQSAFNQHNEQSAVFRRSGLGAEDALFYPFGGKGSGKWALHHSRARAWLERKALRAP